MCHLQKNVEAPVPQRLRHDMDKYLLATLAILGQNRAFSFHQFRTYSKPSVLLLANTTLEK